MCVIYSIFPGARERRHKGHSRARWLKVGSQGEGRVRDGRPIGQWLASAELERVRARAVARDTGLETAGSRRAQDRGCGAETAGRERHGQERTRSRAQNLRPLRDVAGAGDSGAGRWLGLDGRARTGEGAQERRG